MSADGMETTATSALRAQVEDRRASSGRGDAKAEFYLADIEGALAETDRLLARVKAAEAERDALVKERDWLIECNGRSAVRAERAEDNKETSLRLRDQALTDAVTFLAERDAATARIAELEAGLRAFKIACGLRARSLPSKGQPT